MKNSVIVSGASGRALIFLSLCALCYVLWLLQAVIVPFIFSLILAGVLSPMVDFLSRRGWPSWAAISVVMLLVAMVLFAIALAVLSQFDLLASAWPQLIGRLTVLLDASVRWASAYFDIGKVEIKEWLTLQRVSFFSESNAMVGSALSSIGAALTAFFLLPVYVYMILFYRPRLIEFLHRVFGVSNNARVSEVLLQTRLVIQQYLYGLTLEIVILAILNTLGLVILGIDYAVLLGIFGALLNLIPYLGGIIGMAIYVIIALLTKPGEYVIYVILLYGVIQFADNNFIVPKVVGGKVRLNALVSLLAVILGATLWGLPGMFLSIPILAIMKLIFDQVPLLHPYGYLLGETVKGRTPGFIIRGDIRQNS